MKVYRVDFKPVSPYFFGNEKTFPYTGQTIGQNLSNSYYIKSERMPSQTTILGAIRYLFLAHKKNDYTYTEKEFKENAKRVGAESFDISKKEAQNFGIIENISPIFLYHREKGILIPTPFDHNEKSDTENKIPDENAATESASKAEESCEKELIDYKPFGNYDTADTPDKKKLYTSDYDAKIGLTDSYMILKTRKIVPSNDIFLSEERTAIAIDRDKKAFLKKKYAMLKEDYSFSVYLTLSDDDAVDTLKSSENGAISVFMGQGKSAFIVSFAEEKNPMETNTPEKTEFTACLKRTLPKDINGEVLYLASDAVIADSNALYANTLFSIVKTKDYRAFGMFYSDTKNGKTGNFKKENVLYKFISAGSLFIVSDAEDVLKLFENANAQKIGLNQIVKG